MFSLLLNDYNCYLFPDCPAYMQEYDRCKMPRFPISDHEESGFESSSSPKTPDLLDSSKHAIHPNSAKQRFATLPPGTHRHQRKPSPDGPYNQQHATIHRMGHHPQMVPPVGDHYHNHPSIGGGHQYHVAPNREDHQFQVASSAVGPHNQMPSIQGPGLGLLAAVGGNHFPVAPHLKNISQCHASLDSTDSTQSDSSHSSSSRDRCHVTFKPCDQDPGHTMRESPIGHNVRDIPIGHSMRDSPIGHNMRGSPMAQRQPYGHNNSKDIHGLPEYDEVLQDDSYPSSDV